MCKKAIKSSLQNDGVFHSQQAPCSSVLSASLSPHSGRCTPSPHASGLSWGSSPGPRLGSITVRSKVRLSISKMTFCSTQMDTASYEHGDEGDFLSCVICIACMLYTYICMFSVCRYVHVWYNVHAHVYGCWRVKRLP